MSNTPISGVRLSETLRSVTTNEKILTAFRRVPRNSFLSESFMPSAGKDTPLPIGHSQTTSSPSIIAKMLDMLFSRVPLPSNLLEIGAGCGYQTAILAELQCEVVGLERIRSLADSAQKRLKTMGYKNVSIYHADGFNGYEPKAPYAGVIICAECEDIPEQLLKQINPTGYIILPLRNQRQVQLTVVNASGRIVARKELVSFVPLKNGLA